MTEPIKDCFWGNNIACEVTKRYPDGSVLFAVINGGWRGILHSDQLSISYTARHVTTTSLTTPFELEWQGDNWPPHNIPGLRGYNALCVVLDELCQPKETT
jgi:hypothetical protein